MGYLEWGGAPWYFIAGSPSAIQLHFDHSGICLYRQCQDWLSRNQQSVVILFCQYKENRGWPEFMNPMGCVKFVPKSVPFSAAETQISLRIQYEMASCQSL